MKEGGEERESWFILSKNNLDLCTTHRPEFFRCRLHLSANTLATLTYNYQSDSPPSVMNVNGIQAIPPSNGTVWKGSALMPNDKVVWRFSNYPNWWDRISSANVTNNDYLEYSACIASNSHIQLTCCQAANGTIVDSNANATTEILAENGGIHWCETGRWSDFEGCYRSNVPSSRIPKSIKDTTESSVLYTCQMFNSWSGGRVAGSGYTTSSALGGPKATMGGLIVFGLMLSVLVM